MVVKPAKDSGNITVRAINMDEKKFLHPVVRTIILHFMLAYDHPFVDGNDRTARALFYWRCRIN